MQINISDRDNPLTFPQALRAAYDIMRLAFCPTDYVEIVAGRRNLGRVAFKADGKTIAYFKD